eukprot:TRINITY_DN239_c1_g1_i7.p11 TRINITY_DN239_c1_g1~~TRINITY_DN239_c1_g1_i7.p11  ORF type:complete len:102 (-),score=1.39 TRINITY_DN239_c1_g1_i7:1615-1920(-)
MKSRLTGYRNVCNEFQAIGSISQTLRIVNDARMSDWMSGAWLVFFSYLQSAHSVFFNFKYSIISRRSTQCNNNNNDYTLNNIDAFFQNSKFDYYLLLSNLH